MYNSSLLVIQKLLSTNAYLGHQIPTSDFQGYLYEFRNEMAIINLEKTLICLQRACNLIEFIIRAKGHFLLDASTFSPFNSFPRFRKMQKYCLVRINANKNSMAMLEADRLQIPIVSLVDSNIPNKLQKSITYPILVNDDSIQFVYLFCNLITKTIILSQSV
ncbi:hypothetical protein CY35_11G108800 [Sphagnum magellanicum]|nr:hypothetical protein CY35_11G108800 [Sphagnum magellanicum]